MTKICNCCEKEKPLTEFYFRLTGECAGQPRNRCKVCQAEFAKNRYAANPQKYREYRMKNRTKAAEASRQWRLENPGKRSILERRRDAERRKTDPGYRIKYIVRRAVLSAIARAGGCKRKRTVKYLGCPIADFRAHIEKHFWQGMSWQNQGQWHLDHIKPCASFDLSDPAQQAACFHWLNWQPLWADDNLAKSDRLNWTPAESQHTQ